MTDQPQDPKQLAEELAAHLGREQGGLLLERARAMAAVLNSNRPGSQTTEFKMALMALLAGLALVTLGVMQEQPELRSQGLELIQWSVAGYALSRGIAKAGAPKQDAKPSA